MPTDTQAQQLNQFVSQPINNLLAFQTIISLGIVVGIIILVWKFGPALYSLYKQQAETNAKLTKIVEDGEKRASERTTALAELSEQTNKQMETLTSIGEKTDHQTNVLENMGKVFSDHQITTHDTVANLSDKVDSLERTVNELKRVVGDLDTSVKGLSNCDKIIDQLEKWKTEVITEIKEQAKRETDSQPIVILPPNVILPDTANPASDADGANEKAAA